MRAGIGRGVLAMAAALSLSGLGGVDLSPRAQGVTNAGAPIERSAPSSPALPVESRQIRRKDKRDRKRRKPLKAALTARDLLGLGGVKVRKGRPGNVYTINQAMKRGGHAIEVERPERYLNASRTA